MSVFRGNTKHVMQQHVDSLREMEKGNYRVVIIKKKERGSDKSSAEQPFFQLRCVTALRTLICFLADLMSALPAIDKVQARNRGGLDGGGINVVGVHIRHLK